MRFAIGGDLANGDRIPLPAIGLKRLPPIIEHLAVGAPSLPASRPSSHQRYVQKPGTGRLNQPHIGIE